MLRPALADARLDGLVMTSHHGTVLSSIWSDPQFRDLTMPSQWLYMRLLSSPLRNLVGVVPLQPRAWRSSVVGVHLDDIAKALDELATSRFVLTDDDADELLIRTAIKHDPPRNPSATLGMWRQWQRVGSRLLRATVVTHMPAEVWQRIDPSRIPPEAHDLREHCERTDVDTGPDINVDTDAPPSSNPHIPIPMTHVP